MKRVHCEWADDGCTGDDASCKCLCCIPVKVIAEGTTVDGEEWGVLVRRPTPNTRWTVFQVGVQSFHLVESEVLGPEDVADVEQHCEFIGTKFAQALVRIGVPR